MRSSHLGRFGLVCHLLLLATPSSSTAAGLDDAAELLASGNADRKVIAGFRERPYGVVDKPFDPEVLVKKLRDVL